MKTLHLMTQDDQPYGSQRKCCELCGLMMVARPDAFWKEHAWTDDQQEFHQTHDGYVRCDAPAPAATKKEGEGHE